MRRITVLLTFIALVGGVLAAHAGPAAAAGPSVTVGDVQVTEGDSGSVTVQVPVDLSVPAPGPIVVPYSIHASSDGTADAADARFKTGVLKFAAGASSKAIAVVVLSDTTSEADQHVSISLGQPTGGAVIGDGEGSVDIVDDDANGENPGMDASVGSASVEEADSGVHTVYLPVTLSRPATSTVKLVFTVGCSTASFVTDVKAPKTGSITFQAGQRSKSISFRVNADTTPETTKAMIRDFTETTGNAVLTTDTSNTTIVDDDGNPVENDGTLYDCGHGLPGFQPESVPADHFDQGAAGDREQLDLAPDGSQPVAPDGHVNSDQVTTSADGSVVAFTSDASNLVPGDTNGMADVFVRDRRSNTTERVDVKADGSQIQWNDMGILSNADTTSAVLWSVPPALSADGRYVAFATNASLIPEDDLATPHGWVDLPDAYVYDRVTHALDLVSRNAAGGHGGAYSSVMTISAHGRYVTFNVLGGYALAPDAHDIVGMVRDRTLGNTLPLLDGPSWNPTVSADGSTVLIADRHKASGIAPLLAVNLATGTTDRVDVTSDGTPAVDSDNSGSGVREGVSPDGRYAMFWASSWNLIPGATGPGSIWPTVTDAREYIRDRVSGTTTMLPYAGAGTVSYVSYHSTDASGRHLLIYDGNPRLALWDLSSMTMTRVGIPSPGSGVTQSMEVNLNALSLDGRYAVYQSQSGWSSVPDTVVGHVWVERVS